MLCNPSAESIRRTSQLTNSHHDQETRAEPSEIHNRTTRTLHEVIGVCAASTDEVWQRCDNVGRYYEEGQIVMPEGGGEDDEEEADGEDLDNQVSFYSCTRNEVWSAHEGESDDSLEACCHNEAACAEGCNALALVECSWEQVFLHQNDEDIPALSSLQLTIERDCTRVVLFRQLELYGKHVELCSAVSLLSLEVVGG